MALAESKMGLPKMILKGNNILANKLRKRNDRPFGTLARAREVAPPERSECQATSAGTSLRTTSVHETSPWKLTRAADGLRNAHRGSCDNQEKVNTGQGYQHASVRQ